MKIFSLLKMPMPFTLSLLIGLAMVAQAELVDLAVIDAENMKKTPEGWEALATIYLPGKQGYGIEAEKASSVLTQPGDFRIVKGDEASGGAFLFSPLALTIELEVIKKGAYSFNLRMRNNKDFVSPSSLNKFTDKKASPSMPAITVDGKKILCENFKSVGDKFSWQKITAFEMETGFHKIGLSMLPGYDLDRIVLIPAGPKDFRGDALPQSPDSKNKNNLEGKGDGIGDGLEDLELKEESAGPDLGKVAESPTRMGRQLSLTTVEVSPLAVKSWRKIEVKGDLAACPPKVSVSADHGKTWLEIADYGDLSGVKTNGDGKDYLQARLQWQPGQDSRRPLVKAISIDYTVGAADSVVVAGDSLSMVFDRKTASLYEIYASKDRRLLCVPFKRDLFHVDWCATPNEKIRTLNASEFAVKNVEKKTDKGCDIWEMTFFHAESAIQVAIEIQPALAQGQEWLWTLTLDNGGKGTVMAVAGPILNDIFVGGLNLLPEALWGVKGKGIFPGRLSMGYAFVANDQEGLYMASLDKSLTAVELTADTKDSLTTLAATSYGVVPPGKKREYAYAFAYGDNDWHWAADHYRKWAMSWMKRPQWPAWARRTDGWWSLLADTEAGLLDRHSTTIFEEARWFGLPYMQLWVGCGDGEFCGRLPYLSPRLGTPEMSRKDSERVRQMGGHIGVYIQSQEWDASFADADRIGFISRRYFPPDFKVEDRAWSNIWVVNGSKGMQGDGMRYMCAATSAWRGHIARHAGERVELFGHDAAYIDQMGCVLQACNSPEHEHAPEYRASGVGFTAMAEESLQAMRKHNPDVTVAQEGMNAATGQHVQFHLASSMPRAEHGKEFLYTFPDTSLFRGSGNGVFQNSGGSNPHSFFRDLYLFHRFEIPVYDMYFRDVILLRQRINDWQYDGRFMDDVGLNISPASTAADRPRAKWFLYQVRETQGILINFRNEAEATDAVLTLDRKQIPFPLSGHAFIYDDRGTVEPISCSLTETLITLNIPAKKVGSILIPGPVAPAEKLRCFAYQSYSSGPDRVVLTAVNISGEPLAIKWSLNAPSGFDPAQRSGDIDLAPYGIWRIEIPLTGLSTAQTMGEAVVEWRYGGETRTCRTLLSPPLRNGSMDLDENADGSPDSWWNFNSGFINIIHRFVDDVDMRSLPAVCDNEIKRSGRSSVRLPGSIRYIFSFDNAFGKKGWERAWSSELSQHLFLKPSTRYRITAYVRYTDKAAKAVLKVDSKEVASTATPNQWLPLTLEFKTAEQAAECRVTLANSSPEGIPVWFDDVSLEEVQIK